MKKVVAFTGPSNSGKTTLIEKLALNLRGRDRRVVIIKHDPKDKAVLDQEGKDSYKFFHTDSDVAIISPKRTTLFFHKSYSVDEVIEMFGDFDLLMVEGLKHLKLPRVAVFRGKIDESYFSEVLAIAIDDSIDLEKESIPKNIDILDLNSIDEMIEWIERNAKAVDINS
jgi:molybdopterin-guanine dinucleotide biosynthesis protein B